MRRVMFALQAIQRFRRAKYTFKKKPAHPEITMFRTLYVTELKAHRVERLEAACSLLYVTVLCFCQSCLAISNTIIVIKVMQDAIRVVVLL